MPATGSSAMTRAPWPVSARVSLPVPAPSSSSVRPSRRLGLAQDRVDDGAGEARASALVGVGRAVEADRGLRVHAAHASRSGIGSPGSSSIAR